ncbi:MAG: aminoacyl-tRNA hydrolase [Patescibacteria group bacterium]
MILIVGLGNPEPEYAGTRHNLGAASVKPLAEHFDNKFTSLFAKLSNSALISLPQTYMNESGRSVSEIKNFYKINQSDIWIVHDEVDLPLGTIRVNVNASAAGHRGVQSVIDHLGTQHFWRIRLGIGRPPENIPTDAYVIQKFSPEELEKIPSITDKAKATIARYLHSGISEETIHI